QLVAIAPATTAGPLVPLTLVYRNAGAQPLANVVVRDLLLPGETFVSATGGGANAGGAVRWDLGMLAPGATGSVTVNARLGGAGVYANQGVATWTRGMQD